MILPLFLIFCTAGLVGYVLVPTAYKKTSVFNRKRAQRFSHKLDRVMPRKQIQKVVKFYLLAPIVLGVISYISLPESMRLLGVVLGFIAGVFFPGVYTKILISKNKRKFNSQLIDALMVMSSSFRGGLSLVQALEAVIEEMPEPMSPEISTVLAENNMGVSLDEALAHLYNRNPSPALQQTTTAILLARETGGNLPVIFSRIVVVLRQRKRIEGQIQTLTIQGKIQGIVMSLLPVAFFCVIFSSNPHFFDEMFNTKIGRMLMVYAVCSEFVGGIMIWKISAFKDF